jgi:hypothetical protein
MTKRLLASGVNGSLNGFAEAAEVVCLELAREFVFPIPNRVKQEHRIQTASGDF